jgi:hypothetical protein
MWCDMVLSSTTTACHHSQAQGHHGSLVPIAVPPLRLPVAATVAKLKAHDGGDLGLPPRDGSGLVPIASSVDPVGEPRVLRTSRGR